MKKGDWFKYMIYGEDSKFSIAFKCTQVTKRENKPNIVHFDNIDGDNVEVSEGICKKLTRKEVMYLAKEKIDLVCEEFGLWTGGEFTVDGSWAVLRCRKTGVTIEI